MKTIAIIKKPFSAQVASLIAELAAAAAAEKGLTFDEGMEDRLCAYSRAVAHFPTAVKEVGSLNIMIIQPQLSIFRLIL